MKLMLNATESEHEVTDIERSTKNFLHIFVFAITVKSHISSEKIINYSKTSYLTEGLERREYMRILGWMIKEIWKDYG
jgi:hypothetical protein